MHKLRHLLAPLRVFDALARCGGVGGAAVALHVTPGAVSQQLKYLESELGVSLCRKTGRHLMLTDEGVALAARLRQSFDGIESAVRDAQEAQVGSKLRLKVMPTFAICWLLPRLADFYAQHAQVDVEVSTSTAPSAEVTQGQSDFTVRHGNGQWPGLNADLIFRDQFTPVCAPSLAARIKRPIDLLAFDPLHSFMRPDAWDIWLKQAHLDMGVRARGRTLGTASMCYQAAIQGMGVAMAQMSYVAADLREGRLVQPLDIVASTEEGYYFVFEQERASKPAHRAFRNWLSART